MQLHLYNIQAVGRTYGLELNLKKCVCIKKNTTSFLKFENGEKVPVVREATYLGCDLNQETDMAKEVRKRIGKCNAVLQRMHIFWLHSSCTKAFKLRVYNSVIRSKLMYGLESAQLNPADLKQLDVFHLKGLRKILALHTTWGQMQKNEPRTNKTDFIYTECAKIMLTTAKIKKIQIKTACYPA